MIIRAATLDDVPAMAALRSASAWAGGAAEAVVRAYLAGAHHPQGALAPRAAWLAVAPDGTCRGYAAGHQTTRFGAAAELQWLLVAPAARGLGVGDALVAAFLAWCAPLGPDAVVIVNVAPENAPARRLYARHGAEPLVGHEDHWMAWAPGGGRALPAATAPGATRAG